LADLSQEPEQRCLVPLTSFAEPDSNQGPKSVWTWFARDESRPLMFLAGIWREWEGDRGTKVVPDVGKHLVFSFLSTDGRVEPTPARVLSALSAEVSLIFRVGFPYLSSNSTEFRSRGNIPAHCESFQPVGIRGAVLSSFFHGSISHMVIGFSHYLRWQKCMSQQESVTFESR